MFLLSFSRDNTGIKKYNDIRGIKNQYISPWYILVVIIALKTSLIFLYENFPTNHEWNSKIILHIMKGTIALKTLFLKKS
jgi:hypothetical protein